MPRSVGRAAGGHLHDRCRRTNYLFQRSRRQALGTTPCAWEQRVVGFVEALLAGWPADAARPVRHGASAAGEPANQRHGDDSRTPRWRARAVHFIFDPPLRGIGRSRRRRQHAGRDRRAQTRRGDAAGANAAVGNIEPDRSSYLQRSRVGTNLPDRHRQRNRAERRQTWRVLRQCGRRSG